MTKAKAKATKLDKEIQEGLYDPKKPAIKNVFVMKGGHIPLIWHPGESYITTAQLKARHKGIVKIQKAVGVKPDSFEQTVNRFRKDFPKVSLPYDLASVPSHWYEAMVKGIKKSSDVRNPYAIVKSIWAKLSPSKKAEFRAREKKGERFKYDLPLPVDKPTRGTGTVRMVKSFKLAEVQVNLSVKDYLSALKSGLFSRMKRHDGTTALVARCKSPSSNVNVFVDKAGAK